MISWIRKRMNEALGYLSYNWKLDKPLNKATVLLVETTNVCNLDCIMCPRRDMKRKIGTMSMQDFKKIINRIARYTSSLMLHHFGEPLLDKEIYEKIQYCKKKGLKTSISTNATMLNNDNAIKLLNSGLDKLYLCMDGFTKDTYEKVRSKSDFETTKSNIINFMEQRKKFRTIPTVILQMIRMKETESEVKDFLDFWKQYDFSEIMIKDFCTWGDQVDGIKDLSDEDQRYLKGSKKRPACYYLWHSVVVYWDGTVVPCCRDFDGKFVLGNIFKDSLDKIWHGDKLVNMRKQHNNLDFSNVLCQGCYDMPDINQCWYLFSKKNVKQISKHFLKKSSL